MYSPEQLSLLAEHIPYEVDMLHELRRRIRGALSGDVVVRNAVLESFLLHARSLDAFLGPRAENARPDDVFAEDFVSGWRRTGTGLGDKRSRVNKEIAHLTVARAEEITKYWPIDSTADDLLGDMVRFAVKLPESVGFRGVLVQRWQELAGWEHLFGLLSSRSIVQSMNATTTVHPLAGGLAETIKHPKASAPDPG